MVVNGELYTNIMEKLKFKPSIDESNITVAVKDAGIVILGGTVRSYKEYYNKTNLMYYISFVNKLLL